MEWITIADWPGGTLAVFEELSAKRGTAPEGILARYVGEEGGGLRVVAVWESKEAAERFFTSMPEEHAKRLAPASGGLPSVTTLASQNSYVA
jgi:hypothetical protein